jgi:xylulokinase
MSLLGLDIGTTGCKAVVFNNEGVILSSHYKSYPMLFPAPGLCELDTGMVESAIIEVVRTAAAAVKSKDPVKAIGISTLGDSVTLLDDRGRPVSNTVVGAADRRAVDQTKRLEDEIGRERIFEQTGAPLHAFCVIPKVLWFRENQPEVFNKAAKYAGLQEIAHNLLGVDPHIDYSLAGRTMLLDIHKKTWPEGIFSAAEIDPEKFYPLAFAAKAVGTVGTGAAERFGLQPGVTVVAGGFDQSCCALGAGVIEPGMAANSVGTLEAITPVFKDLRIEKPLLTGNHGCIPGLTEGYFTSLAYVTTSGSVVKWYHDTLAESERLEAEKLGVDSFNYIIESATAGPSGVYVLPYFEGSGTPWLDIHQYGSFFGVKLSTTKADLMKGILEGISFDVKLNLESFAGAGIDIHALRSMGGGSRSDAWMQLKADILGIPVERTPVTEAGCLGAAFLAGLGCGVYSDIGDVSRIIDRDRTFEPDHKAGSDYQEHFEKYREIRNRMEGLTI